MGLTCVLVCASESTGTNHTLCWVLEGIHGMGTTRMYSCMILNSVQRKCVLKVLQIDNLADNKNLNPFQCIYSETSLSIHNWVHTSYRE